MTSLFFVFCISCSLLGQANQPVVWPEHKNRSLAKPAKTESIRTLYLISYLGQIVVIFEERYEDMTVATFLSHSPLPQMFSGANGRLDARSKFLHSHPHIPTMSVLGVFRTVCFGEFCSFVSSITHPLPQLSLLSWLLLLSVLPLITSSSPKANFHSEILLLTFHSLLWLSQLVQ
jgi:hypothetical protein